MSNLINYLQTIKFLKIKQIFYRFLFKIKKRYLKKGLEYKLSNLNLLKKNIQKKSLIYKGNEVSFSFQNIKKKIKNYKFDEKLLPKLWMYNLHYFDYLNDNKNNTYYTKIKIKLIHDWIDHSHSNISSLSLDPYPTSLRITNWIQWIVNNNVTDKKIYESLYSQLLHLNRFIEYHILANHLFANAKALIFGGLFFNDYKSDLIYLKGIKLLKKELKEQILKDGGHYEQSPMYHNIITEDVLDIYNILNSNKKLADIKKLTLKKTLNKMIIFMSYMSHPDGEVSFFNDSCFSIASKKLDILRYSKNLKIFNSNYHKKISFIDFPQSGYSIIKNKNFFLIYDRADVKSSYQPGHTHADTLSFELSFYKKRFIVNSGINTYEYNNSRIQQRGSSSHNTLVVNGVNSSNIWHSFRLGNRAKIIKKENIVNKKRFLLTGSHDGYLNKFNTIHSRALEIKKKDLIVYDKILAKKNVEITIYFYFFENFNFKIIDNNNIFIKQKKFNVNILINDGCNAKIIKSNFYPTFGIYRVNKCLQIKSLVKKEKLIKTCFQFNLNDQ